MRKKPALRFLIGILLVLFGLMLLPLDSLAREISFGNYEVVNTAGFREIDGTKTPLSTEAAISASTMALFSDGDTLMLWSGETRLKLYRIASGLEGLQWNSNGTELLHREDILSLSQKANLADVETWGAAIDWPGAGHVKMVMFRLSERSFAGFLISNPGASTLVRQMEFHLLSGPRHRSPQ